MTSLGHLKKGILNLKSSESQSVPKILKLCLRDQKKYRKGLVP